MRARVLALALAGLALAGCGSSPPSRFFILDSVPPAGKVPAVTGPPIVVDAVAVPEFLDRPEMVRRLGPNRLDISGRNRWAASLGTMIQRVLIQDLALRLPSDMVPVPGRSEPVGRSRVLVVSIDDFAAGPTGKVTLDAAWTLAGGDGQKTVLRRQEEIEVPMSGRGADAQAAAMSDALGELADRVAAALADRQSH